MITDLTVDKLTVSKICNCLKFEGTQSCEIAMRYFNDDFDRSRCIIAINTN